MGIQNDSDLTAQLILSLLMCSLLSSTPPLLSNSYPLLLLFFPTPLHLLFLSSSLLWAFISCQSGASHVVFWMNSCQQEVTPVNTNGRRRTAACFFRKWLIYFHNGIKLLFIVLLHSIKKSTEVCSSPSSSCLHVNNMQTTCNMQTVHVHNLGFILAVYTRFILVSDGPGLNPKHSMIFIMLLIMFDWETWEWCQNITNGVISN